MGACWEQSYLEIKFGVGVRVPVLQHSTAMGHPAWLDNAQTTDWVCWRLGESREVKESSLSNQFGHWYSSPVSGLDWLPSADVHRFQSVTRSYWKKTFSDLSKKLERKNCLIQKHCLGQDKVDLVILKSNYSS